MSLRIRKDLAGQGMLIAGAFRAFSSRQRATHRGKASRDRLRRIQSQESQRSQAFYQRCMQLGVQQQRPWLRREKGGGERSSSENEPGVWAKAWGYAESEHVIATCVSGDRSPLVEIVINAAGVTPKLFCEKKRIFC